LEFNVPFEHKYGYIRDERKLSVIIRYFPSAKIWSFL